jgi:hypothetical protein
VNATPQSSFPAQQDVGGEERAGPLSRSAAELHALKVRVVADVHRDRLWFGTAFGLLTVVAVGLFFVGLGGRLTDPQYSGQPYFEGLGVAVVLGVLLFSWAAQRRIGRFASIEQAELELRTEEEVRQADNTDLGALLDVNRALLTQYHGLSTGQARTAFRMALTVMVAAAALFIGGCGIAVTASGTVTGVTVAGLSGLVSAVGGYISTTLLRTYQISVRQAEAYFREPVVASYLLAAERVARSMNGEAQQQAALGRVVDGFMRAATGVATTREDTASDRPGSDPTESATQ